LSISMIWTRGQVLRPHAAVLRPHASHLHVRLSQLHPSADAHALKKKKSSSAFIWLRPQQCTHKLSSYRHTQLRPYATCV
jgi:hypothetical protein